MSGFNFKATTEAVFLNNADRGRLFAVCREDQLYVTYRGSAEGCRDLSPNHLDGCYHSQRETLFNISSRAAPQQQNGFREYISPHKDATGIKAKMSWNSGCWLLAADFIHI